jgi:prepilin-type processing-associated H-X9-DG protein
MLPCGWDPTVAIPGSTATDLKNWWCNILVDNKFLVAPDSKGKGPVANSVFHCPSGNLDVASIDLTNNTNVPATRADQFGATAYRYWSVDGTTVDCWYGMNASEGDDRFHGHPARRIPANSRVGLMPMSIVKRSSETIMFFDGLIYHIDGNGNRVNARHGRLTQTNLAFYDGHAETFTTASLPGGNDRSNGSTTGAAFAVANLRAKYPPPNPVWLLDQ